MKRTLLSGLLASAGLSAATIGGSILIQAAPRFPMRRYRSMILIPQLYKRPQRLPTANSGLIICTLACTFCKSKSPALRHCSASSMSSPIRKLSEAWS